MRRPFLLPVLLLGPALLLAACARGPSVRQAGNIRGRAPVVEMEPLKLEVVRGPGGPRVEAFDAATLFEQAGQDLQAQRYAEAAAGYDRLIKDFPDSRYTYPALYNAGLSYEGLKRFAEAAARYRRIFAERPESKDALDAQFRLGSCLAEIKDWAASRDVFAGLARRTDLHLSDRVEVLTRLGLAQVESDDLPTAERTFRQALDYFKDNEVEERLDSDFFLAMAQFYLANIQHRYFQKLPLRMPQKQLEQDIEAKSRVFLSAQARYIETIKLKNPVWATAAGFQIGALYREMFDTLINSPLPPELDTDDKKQVYADVLKERLRVLLEKARHIHQKNVQMAERVGVDNDWVRRSTEQMEELDRLLASIPDRSIGSGGTGGGEGKQRPDKDRDPPAIPPPAKRNPDYRPRTVL